MMLFAAAILCLHQNVFAAEGATVTVNGDTLQAGSDAWKVTLDISGDTKITNGKIRVTYDSSQLKQCLYLHPLQNWIQTEHFLK